METKKYREIALFLQTETISRFSIFSNRGHHLNVALYITRRPGKYYIFSIRNLEKDINKIMESL